MGNFNDITSVNDRFQVFYARNDWQTWAKPNGCRFVHMLIIGAGGGGGGGRSGASGIRGGGSGGNCGAIMSYLIPSLLIPDTLYLRVGFGGLGGAANSNGSPGNDTYINTTPQAGSVNSNALVRIGYGLGGNTGTTTAGGIGVGGVNSGNALLRWIGLNIVSNGASTTGSSGAGSITTQGGSINILYPITQGAGGGGTDGATFGAGGNITGLGSVPTIQGGITDGQNGDNGFLSIHPSQLLNKSYPILYTGGAGGAGSVSGNGGNGGNGAFGSGGGGGGGGLTGGRGGKGGDAVVMITCW